MSHFQKRNMLFFLFMVFLVGVSYQFFDRDLAFWVHNKNFRQYPIFDMLTHIPDVMLVMVVIYCIYYSIRFESIRNDVKHRPFRAMIISFAITVLLKDALKIVFGRYWPETWIHNNVSLIRDHAYGFNLFHKGTAYQSFPSGHTANTAAIVTVLWVAYPRFRWVSVVLSAAVVIGLLADNYHFLSDVIAGGWLGGTVALYVSMVLEGANHEAI